MVFNWNSNDSFDFNNFNNFVNLSNFDKCRDLLENKLKEPLIQWGDEESAVFSSKKKFFPSKNWPNSFLTSSQSVQYDPGTILSSNLESN